LIVPIGTNRQSERQQIKYFFIAFTMTTTQLTPQLAQRSDFSPDSRLWVYVCDRALTEEEAISIQGELDLFCHRWTAHNLALKAVAEVFHRQFIFLMVDETKAGASGCSIDKSVHFLEQLGASMRVDFFERKCFVWVGTEGVLKFSNASELSIQVQNNTINSTTLMVNTLVQTKQDLADKWLLPFHQSWHRRIAGIRAIGA
jgi:hypothetical protein